MKKLMQICLLSASLAGLGSSAWAADQKIATFSLRKAFDAYYKTIQSTAAIKLEAAEFEKEKTQMIEDGRKREDEWRKLIDKANDQSLSAEQREKAKREATDKYAELENIKQGITATERENYARLREKEKIRRDDIVKEIVAVVTAHAKAAGYSLVLDPSGESTSFVPVVLYCNGLDDLTDGIIKELNAAAPPGSLDTNTPTASSSTNLLPDAKPPK
jgi:Skp family chaperone for outer membrane proteins